MRSVSPVRRYIMDMNDSLAGADTTKAAVGDRPQWLLMKELGICFGDAATRDCAEPFVLVRIDAADRRLAQPYGLLNHRIQNRGEVAGRGIDHLQYLRRRSLLLQRLARLGQQSRVLHCDHRLRREILEQPDLLVREWADFLPERGDDANYGVILPQRHQQQCANIADLDDTAKLWRRTLEVELGLEVGKMDYLLALN